MSTPAASSSSPGPGSGDGVDLYGLGSVTRVEFAGVQTAELEDAVRRAWRRCLIPAPVDAPYTDPLLASLDPELLDGAPKGVGTVTGHDTRSLLQTLTQQVTYAKIRCQTGRLFMMHAGAVADPGSHAALAFVAKGGTGKTTLMRHLGRRYGYLTDETVGVDASGRIHPYPKPLSIRVTPTTTLKGETAPDDLGLLPSPESAQLRRIVLLGRRDTHEGAVEIEELSLADALSALAPETSALSSLPRPLHWLSEFLRSRPPVVRLHYRDVEALDAVIPELLEA